MAKKLVQITYVVTDAALLKAEKALKANEAAANKADQAINKFGKDAKNAGDGASKSFLSLGTVWKGLIAIGIVNFMSNLAKKTFELGVQQEQLNIAFTTFLGSAEKAKKLLGELTKFAIVTPFTPDQVNNAAKALLSFGVAGNDVIPTLKMLGDVSSGTGKDLTEMAIIFGQIRSTGRLMGQDLLQLINAGFNPLQVISDKTGKTVGRLKTEMEKGLITFDMVSDAFKTATSEGGLFFNLMEKQSQSVGGLLSTVSGNLDEVLKNIFSANTGRVNAFTQMLVKASEGLLLFSLTADQVLDKANASEREKFVEQFKQFATQTANLEEATAVMTKVLNENIDAYEKQLVELQKSSDATEEEEKDILNNLRVKRQQLQALNDYIASLKEEEKATASEGLKKKLEEELKLKEGLAKANKKLFEQSELEREARIATQERRSAQQPQEFQDFLQQFGLNIPKTELQKGLEDITDVTNQRVEIQKEASDSMADAAEALAKRTERANKQIEESEKAKARNMEVVRQTILDSGIALLGQLLMGQDAYNDEDLKKERERLDKRLEMAGNNENARQAVLRQREEFDKRAEKERNEREKKTMIKQMIIQNLQNALKALGTPPVPNFALFGVALATGLAQIGIAKAVGFKEGVIGLEGPGTGTSDSIPARLSRGESVITAEATQRSRSLLEAIQEKRIDDRVLERLVVGKEGISVNKFDDSRMVDRLDRIAGKDYYEQGHFVMQRIRKGDSLTEHSHSKYH